MANSPEWKEYPRRDHICSTDLGGTHDYGVSFMVVPKNGAKVGVCNDFDIWSSGNKELHKPSETLDSINSEMTNVIDQVRKMLEMNTDKSLRYVKDIGQFAELVDEIDKELAKAGVDKIANAINKEGHIRSIGREILISLRKHGSIKEMLFAVYSPKSLGTEIETFPLFLRESREVWVDGEVLFIRYIDEYERDTLGTDKDEEADKNYVADLLKEIKKQLEKS
jgi:polyhydroxyalkanoate synthesis regulator phasin